MDSRAKDLIAAGDKLFEKRGSLVSLWDEIARNFYPERADFTGQRSIGDSFAEGLMTSYPVLARRDLGNAFSAMLRPTAKEWFHIKASREEREDEPARAWLQRAEMIMRRAMYDRDAQFVRATKEGDNDFATFGQTVLTGEVVYNSANGPHLLYRCWHLRDNAWCENAYGKIDTNHRKWQPFARDLANLFPGKLHKNVVEKAEKDPYCEIAVRHIVTPSAHYESPVGKKWKTPYVSIYVDVDNQHIIEEVGVPVFNYIIPRWQTVSGSQYAYSPATITALPDARLIQAMTLTLLEAGEKAASPPMLAVQEAIRSDVDLRAGGVTWVDAEYDERLGEVLRPITQDFRGMPLGIEMSDRTRALIAEAFFISKLNMPPVGGPDMTAYEVGQRVQEYIRNALPLFEPMEMDYNGGLCELSFDLLMRNGAFGSPYDIPPSLKGDNLQFKFESPLSEAIEKQKVNKVMETNAILAQVTPYDPTAARILNAQEMLRDALRGNGTPAKWMRTEEQMADLVKADAAAAALEKVTQELGRGVEIAKTAGEAGVALNEAGMGQAA